MRLALHPSPSCLKALLASRPALPPSRRRTGGRVDRPGVASRCLLGAFSSSPSVLLGLAVHRVYIHLASSPGALLGLATRVSPSLTLSAGRRWPRLVDRFGDIVAGRGVPSPFRFFSMFISSLLVRVVVSHRRFFGMGCGAFLLASRPVVAGWDLQHRRRHAVCHHEHFLPLSGIMSSTSFRSTSRTRST